MYKINEIITIKSLNMDGIIKATYKNKVKVLVKNSILMIDVNDIDGTGIIKTSSSKVKFSKIKLKSNELDLHNYTYDEAVDVLDSFLNNAFSSNTKKLHIIHGIGNGVMKQVVDEAILRYDNLIDFSDYAPLNLGGRGATRIILK